MFSPATYAGTIAAMTKHHGPDYPEIVEVRRQLAEAKLERYIEKVVAEAPPLTGAQIDRLATLLRRDA